MWCPTCGGKVTTASGEIRRDGEIRTVLDTFVHCTRCPWVSQVDPDGELIDEFRAIRVSDLHEEPDTSLENGLTIHMHGATRWRRRIDS